MSTASLSNAEPQTAEGMERLLPSLAGVNLQAAVRLGQRRMSLAQLCQLTPGSVITFDLDADKVYELLVQNQIVAHGQAVHSGERIGFRIKRLVEPESTTA